MKMSEKLRSRIEALRARTMARGCTEAETHAAAKMLRDLLDEHGLTLEEFERTMSSSVGRNCVFGGVHVRGGRDRYAFGAELAIAGFFEVTLVRDERAELRGYGDPVFFGLEQDVAAACALTEIVHAALRVEWKTYRGTKLASEIGAVVARSFKVGFAGRVAQRLREGRRDLIRAKNALVVLKRDLVVREAAAAGVVQEVGGAWSDKTTWDDRAYGAGWSAGDRLTLGTAVEDRSEEDRERARRAADALAEHARLVREAAERHAAEAKAQEEAARRAEAEKAARRAQAEAATKTAEAYAAAASARADAKCSANSAAAPTKEEREGGAYQAEPAARRALIDRELARGQRVAMLVGAGVLLAAAALVMMAH